MAVYDLGQQVMRSRKWLSTGPQRAPYISGAGIFLPGATAFRDYFLAFMAFLRERRVDGPGSPERAVEFNQAYLECIDQSFHPSVDLSGTLSLWFNSTAKFRELWEE